MTKSELEKVIRDICGVEIADAVGAFKREHLDPLRASTSSVGDVIARALGDRGGALETRPDDKGLGFARCIRATAAAKLAGTGASGAIDVLKKWGDHDLAEKWAEARQKALAAGDATAGGFLVPTQFSADVIEFLRAQTVVRRLNARTMPVPTGTIKVPKLT